MTMMMKNKHVFLETILIIWSSIDKNRSLIAIEFFKINGRFEKSLSR
jgi:hypothetical protein